MIGLDVGAFSPEIAKLFLLRGAVLPPVIWNSEAHRSAKKALDTLDDAALFGQPQIANEEMAAAVRALMYLWTGWTAECLMFSQGAAAPERLYISGLCERHNQHFSEAKSFFKQFESHPIHEDLTNYTLGAASNSADEAVKRVREMLKIDKRWEPFLFCDAVAQAGAGKLRSAGENFVRQVQCREFELLLAFCYEQATGSKLSQRKHVEPSDAERKAAERERRMREERKHKQEKRQREEFAAKMKQFEAPGSRNELPAHSMSAPKTAEPMIGVVCPKCGSTQEASASARGKAVKCSRCSTGFLVPKPGGSAESAGSAAGPRTSETAGSASAGSVVAILCPKCGHRLLLAASARGKRATCTGCSTAFMVPQLQAAGAHS